MNRVIRQLSHKLKPLSGIEIRYSLSSNRSKVLTSIKTYPNSKGQKHLHNFDPNGEQIEKIKAGIDYASINLYSSGRLSFRQNVFQQKIHSIPVSPINCYLEPTGDWSYYQVTKSLEMRDKKTRQTSNQIENREILQGKSSQLNYLIKMYYLGLGKKNYQFILNQEINRIRTMSTEQFQSFSRLVQKGIAIHAKQASIQQPKSNQSKNNQ